MSFWIAAIRPSFNRACGTLGFVSLGSTMIRILILIVVVFALYYFGRDDAAQDELLIRGILVFLAILVFPIVFLFELFREPKIRIDQYKSTVRSLKSSLSKVETNQPNLSATIEAVWWGAEPKKFVVCIIEVKNTGGMPSDFSVSSATIKRPEFESPISAVAIAGEITIHMEGKPAILKKEHCLIRKQEDSIPSGTRISGYLFFPFTQNDANITPKGKDEITISFKDINERIFGCTSILMARTDDRGFLRGIDS